MATAEIGGRLSLWAVVSGLPRRGHRRAAGPGRRWRRACANTLPAVPRACACRRPEQHSIRTCSAWRQGLVGPAPDGSRGPPWVLPLLRYPEPASGRAPGSARPRAAGAPPVGPGRARRRPRADRGPAPTVPLPVLRRCRRGGAAWHRARPALRGGGDRPGAGPLGRLWAYAGGHQAAGEPLRHRGRHRGGGVGLARR